MTGFNVLLQKEWREQTRNLKLLWIPLVFVIFGILEPVTFHYLPEIMKSVGNMPEASEFLMPELTGEEILVSLLGQYQLVGILVVVLAFMGSISGERKTGAATLLYVRPMSFSAYFISKWLVINVIVLASVACGIFASWYYVSILFNEIPVAEVFGFIGIYGAWMLFVVTIVLACSAAFTTGVAATMSLIFTLILPLIDSIIGEHWTVSPWKLAMYAPYAFGGEGVDYSNLWWSIGVTLGIIVLLIVVGIMVSKRNAAKTTV